MSAFPTPDNVKPGLSTQTSFRASSTKSAPERPLDSATHIKFHFVFDRGNYDQDYKPSLRRRIGEPPKNLRMVVMDDPTVEDFLYQLQKVGHLYGWDRRRKYQPKNIEEIKELISRPNTKMFLFQKSREDGSGHDDIGFCVITDVVDAPEQRQGTKKTDIIESYKRSHKIPANSNAVEIYKIGLYDEHTGQGYGNYFLARVLHQIFDKGNNDIVYLDTRDTNHRGVVPFYEKHGIRYHLKEEMLTDLIEGPAPDWQKPGNGTVSYVPNGIGGPNSEKPNDDDPSTNTLDHTKG